MTYESTAEPIKIGYPMDFLLSDDYPKERRDDLTIKEALERVEMLPAASGSPGTRSFVRKLDAPSVDGRRLSRGPTTRCRRRQLSPGRSLR